jgi:hypothetical protein
MSVARICGVIVSEAQYKRSLVEDVETLITGCAKLKVSVDFSARGDRNFQGLGPWHYWRSRSHWTSGLIGRIGRVKWVKWVKWNVK